MFSQTSHRAYDLRKKLMVSMVIRQCSSKYNYLYSVETETFSFRSSLPPSNYILTIVDQIQTRPQPNFSSPNWIVVEGGKNLKICLRGPLRLVRNARPEVSAEVSRLRAFPVSVSKIEYERSLNIPVSVAEGVCIDTCHASTGRALSAISALGTSLIPLTMTCDCPQPKRSVKNDSKAFCSVYVALTIAIGIVK
jgi:hypothetical protein